MVLTCEKEFGIYFSRFNISIRVCGGGKRKLSSMIKTDNIVLVLQDEFLCLALNLLGYVI